MSRTINISTGFEKFQKIKTEIKLTSIWVHFINDKFFILLDNALSIKLLPQKHLIINKHCPILSSEVLNEFSQTNFSRMQVSIKI